MIYDLLGAFHLLFIEISELDGKMITWLQTDFTFSWQLTATAVLRVQTPGTMQALRWEKSESL